MRPTNKIIRGTIPSTPQSRVRFQKNDFDALIEIHGYDVYHDRMIECPCKTKQANGHRSDCKNCSGYGWVLIKRTQTKMILQSMNNETKFKEWSEEKLGTISVTAYGESLLEFMDRIIIIDSATSRNCVTGTGDSVAESFNQLIYPTIYPTVDGSYFSFLTYYGTSIESVHRFVDSSSILELIDPALYTLDENKIVFDPSLDAVAWGANPTLSIVYNHLPQFHILDIDRSQLLSFSNNENKLEERKRFPIHAVGRRSHLVVDQLNYGKDNLLNND